ncbi:MAG: hypothetical protein MK085_01265 [Phycisphaerales bacterium]|nr:hypothetical protein [Phycisphaerales bacterium]
MTNADVLLGMRSSNSPSNFGLTAISAGLIRLLLLVIVMGGILIGGFAWWTGSREAALRAEVYELENRLQSEIEIREAAIQRLGREQRLARIEILDPEPETHAEGQGPTTSLRFIELDDEGRELGRREYSVPGNVIHVDAWTARFPLEDVAAGQPLRDRTIVLLRRLYSDLMPPREGLPIDTPGGIPTGYAGSERAHYEQAIWSNFWRIASDPNAAMEKGLRVAQGEAVYKPMQPGEAYELRVEASGGMTLVPLGRHANAREADQP